MIAKKTLFAVHVFTIHKSKQKLRGNKHLYYIALVNGKYMKCETLTTD